MAKTDKKDKAKPAKKAEPKAKKTDEKDEAKPAKKAEPKAEKTDTTPAPTPSVPKQGKKYDIVSILAIGAIVALIGGSAYVYHLYSIGNPPAFLKSILGSGGGSLEQDRRHAQNARMSYRSGKYEYRISHVADTWENHKKFAQMWGGNLASLTCDEEVIVVKQKMETLLEDQNEQRKMISMINGGGGGYWLGAKHRHESSGGSVDDNVENASSKNWRWIDDKPWGYGSMMWLKGKHGISYAPTGRGRKCGLWALANQEISDTYQQSNPKITEANVLIDEICERNNFAVYKRAA